ncbi:13524_t:CDS:2 [Racocetra persica]|uniref:13524_t:CDS:1 n=1 Tax=Racocetra persica TaxID=160502 RepID=A0ACA9RI59_9GLOM|nr:13524_t:CDS:2 [Racocetra persica]
MQKKELQKLAQKVQLEIKEEELQNYLDVFKHLEKLLTDFQKVKIEKKTKPLKRINVGSLTLRDLEKLKKVSSGELLRLPLSRQQLTARIKQE